MSLWQSSCRAFHPSVTTLAPVKMLLQNVFRPCLSPEYSRRYCHQEREVEQRLENNQRLVVGLSTPSFPDQQQLDDTDNPTPQLCHQIHC